MALDWLPIYPALPTRPWRRPYAVWETLIPIEPIPNPPPPTELIWNPRYPSQLTQRRLTTSLIPSYVSGFPFLGTQLQARAFYPDQFPPRRRLITGGSTFEISGILDVPKIGGWRPRYPMQLRLPPRASLGFYAFVTPPSVILNAAPCVELGDETLTNPAFGTETARSAAFIEEDVVIPRLVEEDLC